MKLLKWLKQAFLVENQNLGLAIEGSWFGHYKYSPTTHHLLLNRKFKFNMHLTNEKGAIHGFLEEEIIKGHLDDQISIYGKVAGRKIVFNKVYQSLYVMDDSGIFYKDESKHSPHIKYYGYFYPRQQKFIGDWNMSYEDNGISHKINGTWEMQKEGNT